MCIFIVESFEYIIKQKKKFTRFLRILRIELLEISTRDRLRSYYINTLILSLCIFYIYAMS